MRTLVHLALLAAACRHAPKDTGPDTSPGGDSDATDDTGSRDDSGPVDADDDGFSEEDGDCDDSDDSVHPDALEVCDEIDNDCDGTVDEGLGSTFYVDGDGDGYGDPGEPEVLCESTDGYVNDNSDCDDSRGAVNPAASEVCNNGLDDDCDGLSGDCALSGELNLGDADAKLVGSEEDRAGDSVSAAGDVNGDGLADIVIGGWGHEATASTQGAAYVVFGSPSGVFDLERSNIILVGENSGDQAGQSVGGAGDVNGDGFDDVLVGASGYSSDYANAGAAYLILGPASGTLGLGLAELKLIGEGGDYTGSAVANAGDVDADGFDDLLVGAHDHGSTGAAYLVYGPATGEHNLARVGLALLATEAGENAGCSVAAAGDTNGDGFADIIIGADDNDIGSSMAGVAYLVQGPVEEEVTLDEADLVLIGEDFEGHAGRAVAGAGDTNGDGLADVLVGATGAWSGGYSAGATYLVLGAATGSMDLALADAKFVGEVAWSYSGGAVAGAGDTDGDGLADIVVGATGANSSGGSGGAAYLLHGPLEGSHDLSVASLMMLAEQEGSETGSAVAGVGDTDEDGHDDVLVGAKYDDEGGVRAGAAFLVVGSGM